MSEILRQVTLENLSTLLFNGTNGRNLKITTSKEQSEKISQVVDMQNTRKLKKTPEGRLILGPKIQKQEL